MDINFTSTYLLNSRMRDSVQRLQSELSQKQVEFSTGKKYDVGNQLGSLSSHLVAARRQIESIRQVQVTNGLLSERMNIMQTSLTGMVDGAQKMIGQLSAELSDEIDRSLLSDLGKSGMSDFSALLNTTYRGEFVFSGINTDLAAINDYAGAPRTAVRDAFQAEFGMLPNDPAVASIDPAAMTSFLEGAYNDLFADAGWQADWTGASLRETRVKFSLTEVAEIPGTANDGTMRSFAAGYAIMAELGGSQISDETMGAVVNFAIDKLSESISSASNLQARIGVVENRVTTANDRLDYQQSVLKQSAAALEEVDSYEVAMRINELLSAIEASYAVTSKIQGLSIMDYI